MSEDNFNYDFLSKLEPAKIDIPKIPKPTFPDYKDTFLKDLADDVKGPMEKQISSIEDIADSAKLQAESSKNTF